MIFCRRGADLGDCSSEAPSQQEVWAHRLPLPQDGPRTTEARRQSEDPSVTIYPLSSRQGVLLKVDPPTDPYLPSRCHIPCDIVLVIDTSFSMSKLAPVVGLDDDGAVVEENAGFSVLDITKHAALTILESLDDGDRLGIVTFSTKAKVVQNLMPMTARNKELTDKQIRGLKEERSTNLWRGIEEGLNIFKDDVNSGRVPAVMVLTDGQPNIEHPLDGYISAIRSLKPLPATIHTFGFGYSIRSGLLKSIAEVGGGSYAFIPDAGMVGTVFVNAVAHIQSTFANKCSLEVTYPEFLGLTTTTGETIEVREQDVLITSNESLIVSEDGFNRRMRVINLGNLQYGQSRDLYLRYSKPLNREAGIEQNELNIEVRLVYSRMRDEKFDFSVQQSIFRMTEIPETEVAYHQSRTMICDFLASFFPIKADGEHDMPPSTPAAESYGRLRFQNLLRDIPARKFMDNHKASAALMEDVTGQINLAVNDELSFRKWGTHYFLSLWDAHEKQIRNTFKDPGVQIYNVDSQLFIKCQKDLVQAFNTRVEAPEPSRIEQADEKYRTRSVVRPSMSSYFNSNYPCFAASSMVSMADGRRLPVCSLRKGMNVKTPVGNRQVVAILKTRVKKIVLCKIGDLLVTPWHPIVDSSDSGASVWVFPANVAEKSVRYSGTIYSVLLQHDGNVSAHGIQIGGIWGVTLGHGLVSGKDVRSHRFFGDYDKVFRALMVLGIGPGGVVESSGVRREKYQGRASGFISPKGRIRMVNFQGRKHWP